MKVKDKIILITGGSSGIGKTAAKQLFSEGARIIIQARNIDKLKAAALEIDPSAKRVSYYSSDLTDPESVKASADLIIAKEGIPDVIINSAGSGEWLSFKEAQLSHFKETIESPYLATALTCKVFYDKMQARGYGHFIIINSGMAYFSFPNSTGYTPARWAMLGFSKSLQADLYNTKFKVSMVALGKVDSPYFQNNKRSADRFPKVANWLTTTISPIVAGKIIAKTVKTKKATVIKPFSVYFFVHFNRFFPSMIKWIMRITSPKVN